MVRTFETKSATTCPFVFKHTFNSSITHVPSIQDINKIKYELFDGKRTFVKIVNIRIMQVD